MYLNNSKDFIDMDGMDDIYKNIEETDNSDCFW